MAVHSLPSEEFELTANSLVAHMKVTDSSPGMGHGELILRSFVWLTEYSQDEITVSLLWAFREFATFTVSSLLPLHGELIG